MNLRDYLHIAPEVAMALRKGKPIVALASAALRYGVQGPQSCEIMAQIEAAVRAENAVPAVTAVLDGVLTVGLTQSEMLRVCGEADVVKASRRDLSILVAAKQTGATTAAGAMILASLAGIRMFATGGIGGMHRGADVSADLQELRQTPVGVVCAGVQRMADTGRSLEYLETMGVPVLGLATDVFPAFYCRDSGFAVDYNAKTPQEAAAVLRTQWVLGLKGGVLIGSPVPEEYALDPAVVQSAFNRAQAEADEAGVRGKDLTPFLLARVAQLTNGAAQHTQVQLMLSSARGAAQVAAALLHG